MPIPVGKDGRGPRADAMRRGRQQQRLHRGGLGERQDWQRHQDTDENCDSRKLPVVLVDDRTGPGKFRFEGSVQDAPIGPDATFEELPGPVDRFDDVVFHADGLGAGYEIAQHHGLLEPAGIGIAQIVAGAGPAELRDHDPLAGELLAQELVHRDSLVDRLLVGEVLPSKAARARQ